MLRILSAPVIYALELTPACNNHCPGCPNHLATGGSEQQPLSFSTWCRILDRLVPHARRLKLTGGEPTLHPDFLSIAERIDSVGLDFTVFTNGCWEKPETLVGTLSRLNRLTGLLVSLHGASAQSHEAFTKVEGSFQETQENIRRAVAVGLPITISTVLTEPNLDEISDIVQFAEQLGTTHVVFNRYLGPDVDGLTPSPSELACAVRQIETLRREGHAVKFGNCIPQCFLPNESSGCLAGVAYCAVGPSGEVRPCTHSAVVAGNLLEESLDEIWWSAPMQAFRDSISPLCHHCQAFSVCHGGCKALAMNLGLESDPLARPAQGAACPPPKLLVLHPSLRPVGHFDVQREDWGLALLYGNRVCSVRVEAAGVLALLDGQTSLAEIEARCGPSALSLVGTLYQKGFVSLQA